MGDVRGINVRVLGDFREKVGRNALVHTRARENVHELPHDDVDKGEGHARGDGCGDPDGLEEEVHGSGIFEDSLSAC